MLDKLFPYLPTWIQTRILVSRHEQRRREYQLWRARVAGRGDSLHTKFKFKHIIEVDYYKVYAPADIEHYYNERASEFLWPARDLDTACLISVERGSRMVDGDFYITDLGDRDIVVFCTNSDEDAVMISLLFT